MRDLIGTVPTGRRGEFLRALQDQAVAAHKNGEPDRLKVLRRLYPLVLVESGTPEALVEQSVSDLGQLIADDATVDVAIMILPRPVAERLPPRYRAKVEAILIEQIAWNTAPEGSTDLRVEVGYLGGALTESGCNRAVQAIEKKLGEGGAGTSWGLFFFEQLQYHTSPRDDEVLARGAVKALLGRGGERARKYLRRRASKDDFLESPMGAALQFELERLESAGDGDPVELAELRSVLETDG
jgi:hypothetical protein